MRPPIIPRFITNRILLNGIIDLDGARFLKKQGVTHLVNLAGPYPDSEAIQELGLTTVEYDISDQTTLDTEYVMGILKKIESILTDDNNKVYIHCAAGQVRSPTIAWLYLIYTGYSAKDASEKLKECKLHPSQKLLTGLDIDILRHRTSKASGRLRRR